MSSPSPAPRISHLLARIQVLRKPRYFWTNLTNVTTGIMVVIGEAGRLAQITAHFMISRPFLSISLSLNALLTLMTVVRLVLHIKGTRAILGDNHHAFIEFCALFAVNSLLVIGLLAARNHTLSALLPTLAETQVCTFP